jgi:pilus assembly protein Flp/PilA
MACRTRHQVCLTHPGSTIQDGNRRSPSGLGGNNAPTPRSPSGSGRQPEITRMTKLFKNFWSDESGQGLTEYALIIALVAIGLIAILVLFRNSIGNVFNVSRNTLNNAPGSSY